MAQQKRSYWRLLLKIALGTIALLLVAVATLSVVVQAQRSAQVTLPAPTGPYAVGRTLYDWIDPSRAETFAPKPGAHRELMVWVWYPATPPPDAHTAPYLPETWAQVVDDDWVRSGLTQRASSISTHSFADAPLSAAQASYPVLIMQPGMGRIPPDYTVLAESLASHGYIVVGITPTYSSSTVVFPDGRVVHAVPEAADSADLNQLVTVWAADVHFVLGQLDQLTTTPQNRWTGRLDLTRLGFFGHSFGGASAAEACRLESRCKAALDIDGDPYGAVVQTGLRQPLMFLLSEPSQQDRASSGYRDILALYQHMRGNAYEVTIRGAKHDNFLDLAVCFAPVLKIAGGLGSIDGRRGLAITNAYIQAFFDTSLSQGNTPLLGGPSTAYPEVQFESRSAQ
ncbi:MAG: alpha/beta hydrolase family protein [Ktedonobacterales bacterium]